MATFWKICGGMLAVPFVFELMEDKEAAAALACLGKLCVASWTSLFISIPMNMYYHDEYYYHLLTVLCVLYPALIIAPITEYQKTLDHRDA